jgi:hypothetical protein
MGSEAFHHKGRDISIYITRKETQKWLALRSAFIGFITSHHITHPLIQILLYFFTIQFTRRLCCFNSILLLDVQFFSSFLWEAEAGLVLS